MNDYVVFQGHEVGVGDVVLTGDRGWWPVDRITGPDASGRFVIWSGKQDLVTFPDTYWRVIPRERVDPPPGEPTWAEVRRLARFALALRISRKPFPVWLIRAVAGKANIPREKSTP